MAALSRFISRLGEKGLPFFRLLKASEKILLDRRGQRGVHPAQNFPHLTTAPQPNEDLLLYIAATNRVVSTVLVVERDESRNQYTS